MLKNLKFIILAAIIASSLLGCVSKGTFTLMESEANRLESELNDLQNKYNQLNDEKRSLSDQRDGLEQEKNALLADNKQLNLILAANSDSLSEVITSLRQKNADQAADYESQIKENELQIDTLGKKNNDLTNAIALLHHEKEQEVEAMSSTYEDLLAKMKNEINKGQVTISELKGKLTVNMVDAILFDSGEAEVKDQGMEILQKVVDILKSVTDKTIRIEGHTDNVKIIGALTRKYPTNWELSASRALNVAKFLQSQGLNPENLASVAYGEYAPVADNETAEGRAQNRRIEIVLIAKNQ